MSNNDIYWANFRDQEARHQAYVELENLGRNRWQCVIGTDEFVIRTKEKDFLRVLSLALIEAQERADQLSA